MKRSLILLIVLALIFQVSSVLAGKWTSDGKKFVSEISSYVSKVRKYSDRYVVLCSPMNISFLTPELDDKSFGVTGISFSVGGYEDPECLVNFAVKYYKKSKIMKSIEKNYKILIRYDPEKYSGNPYRVLYYDKSMKYLVDMIKKYGSKESKSGLDFMKKGMVIGYWRDWTQQEWDFIKLVSSVKAFYEKSIRDIVKTQCFGGEAYCLLEVGDYLDNADEKDIKEYYIAGVLKDGTHVVHGILVFKIGRKYYLAAFGGKYYFENYVEEDFKDLLKYEPGHIDEKWIESYVKFVESKELDIWADDSALIFYWDPETGKVKGVLDVKDRHYYVPLPSGDGTEVSLKSDISSKIFDKITEAKEGDYKDLYEMYLKSDYPMEYLKRLIVLGVEYYPKRDRYRVWAYKDSVKEIKMWLEKRKKVDCGKIPSGDEKKDLYCKIRIVSGVLSSSDALLRHLEQYRMTSHSGWGYELRTKFDRKNGKIFFIKYEGYPLVMEYIALARYDYYRKKKLVDSKEILERYCSKNGIWLASEFPLEDIDEIVVKTNY